MILERNEGRDDAQKMTHDNDVNFLANVDISMDEGFGAHHSVTEMDTLYAKIDAIT